jgi:N-acetylmuramic acid 6-phosphate etherase
VLEPPIDRGLVCEQCDATTAERRETIVQEDVEAGQDGGHSPMVAQAGDTMRAMARGLRYERLVTERANRASTRLDRLDARGIATLMNREDARAVRAVGRVARDIAAAVDLIVGAFRARGHLIFVGAGTSGRLGVLEAAECPPTFGTPPSRVQAIMAGGRRSVFRSREGAEDDARAGARAIRTRAGRRDVVVGISASGVTPFVKGALAAARRVRAGTVLLTCSPAMARSRATVAGRRPGPARAVADVVIAPVPGAEVLTGSTRLKAGTATKLVLNTLTTASMARLGKVYGNRLVDVQPRSRKLRERAARLVSEIGGVAPARARRLLAAADGRVPVAIVMARRGLSAVLAGRALRAAGSLRSVIERRDGGGRLRRRSS